MKLQLCAGVLAASVAAFGVVSRAEAQAKPETQAKPKPAQAPKKPKVPLPPDTNKWELEFKVRFGSGGPITSDGKGHLPGAGESFITAGQTATRRVTSWLFGDGSTLLNDVLGTFGRPERVVALDAMLNSAAVEHSTGNIGAGVRVSRRWKSNLWIEVDGDYSRASFTLLPTVVPALLATHDSFANAFAGLAASAQGAAFFSPDLDSSVLAGDGTGHEIVVTGALVWEMGKPRRVRPYLVGGAGIAVGFGSAGAFLSENYSFSLSSGARINETDAVDISFSGGFGLVGTAGGGVRIRLSRASGVKVDGRVLMVQNHVNTLVTTRPGATLSQPADAIFSFLTPGIQFSNDPNFVTNLSAPPLSDFKTLSGSGFNLRYAVSAGYYFTF